jgi:hypothetical protein
VTIISPKIREAMKRKTDAELQGVVAYAENWTPPADEAAREELQRRGVPEKLSSVEWLARWPGRAAFAEEDDAPVEGGERRISDYLEAVESRCLYCGAREPLQFHPFVVLAGPSMEQLPRPAAAAAVQMVGRSFGIAGGLVAAAVGRTILAGGAPQSLLLHFVLCDDCADQAVNEEDELPREVYTLHPWVDPLVQAGYEFLMRKPHHSVIVQAAKGLKSPPSAVGIMMV